ncbi:Tetratricopeptide TPR_1 repeat-containing protein (plasmid) [Granulicella tundricola MP5ACTX9]|uniref:Tetratricopeptide TPR_1 repeat-containing protein n=1 Tax=Granulicella tundricola (strain ATCC BAA-1859 / DSM 23138 / MP5ACTX9) TaxID=1198114 RepID=E8X6B4_GRATM|nr:Tetratricopeptide TPR_1 repeat-containing protein [Granulicella tundricola MP5ACTX9]
MGYVTIEKMKWVLVGLLCIRGGFGVLAQSTDSKGLQVRPAAAAQGASATTAEAETLRGLRKQIDTGHADEALQRIVSLRTAGPGAAGYRMAGLSRMEGLALFAQGKLREADTAFADALVEDKGDVESAQMRGLTLFRLGRPADAIPLLEGSKGKANGGDRKADPNYVLALCYIDTRKYDDARHAFAAQFGMEPDGAGAYLLAARMLLRREYLPVAQGFAEKALALQPGLPLAHALLGEIALAGNHLEEAIAQFEKEKISNPLEPSVYDRLGDAYGRAARYTDAQASLQEAVLLEPNSTGPYILLGKTMLKQGDALGATTYLERAVKMDPANYMTHSLLGQAYRTMGRTEDASRETSTAQKLQTASEPKLENLH